ncbi:Protein of unknown function (DUF2911) [Aequorivita sublithincola DSM 14238]|uniref:DUF2911 domain-containing protein n=1 Tax=Aequorivita sublithincola (strain DSM 14238 / LMG 21431 / ACAM 643 / 9-3) TaxID=746697 RepID=I3YSX8_AEQSU|nr:DUF2911 domain-containing protein [Aequorivita sublithincola]AFL80096.1 Protein of unknown function (DUF2911) [Aequorivita sublithincola DSM 14238]
MKKALLIFFIVSIGISLQNLQAQSFPEMDASPMDLVMARPDKKSPPFARVIYSRPQKKGRVIYGDIVPYGKVWRTGANEATELDVYVPMTVGNTTLKPGTYTLYTIPEEDNWTVIINSDTNVWGAYSYKKEKDVLRITVPVKDAAAPIESLSMIFRTDDKGTVLMIGWDNEYVEIPFKKV